MIETEQFDYGNLKKQMDQLAQTAAEHQEELPKEIDRFLLKQKRLPPECADIIFWILTHDLEYREAVRCFDWYTLSDTYQKLTAEHEDMPSVVLAYLRRHPETESEELADFLWFACLYRLAAQNAWQLPCAGRLELFRAFIENMTVYAAHTVRPEAWNDVDIFLFPPELRITYHVSRAYAYLDQNHAEAYVRCLELAAGDCPDLKNCLDTLKELPGRTESPLERMSETEIQAHAVQLAAKIVRTFESEDWIQTAELVKQFDREGFSAGTNFELLRIQCRLAERGLLW